MLKRVRTVGSIGEFLRNDHVVIPVSKRSRKAVESAITSSVAGLLAVVTTGKVFAQAPAAAVPVWNPGEVAKGKIVDAFMPFVDVLQSVADPIALVMMTGGALLFMINQKDRGISAIQNAAIGYIVVQLIPVLMQVLVGIGGAIG